MNLKQWRLTQRVSTKEGGFRTMTQADAARRAGVTRACWHAYEAGKRFPRENMWERIFEAMVLTGGHGEGPIAAEELWREREKVRRAQRKVFDARHATSKRKGR